MARYSGKVGFIVTEEKVPGVWSPGTPIEKRYYGDVYKARYKTPNGDGVNDDIEVHNEISIVGNPYAYANFMYMRYLYWMGVKWKITDATIEYPRIKLTLGGVWNG